MANGDWLVENINSLYNSFEKIFTPILWELILYVDEIK